MPRVDARFPPKCEFLFRPARYKVLHGGRGSSKSWSVAAALIILGVSRELRVLCTREVQRSIKDSVHKLLVDQIQRLGLGAYYEVLDHEIRGPHGTVFIFAGLSDQTVESIKSYEAIDVVWCEEGQAITKRSWDILTPTIRKPGSEIWVTFNPRLDTDETYRRFVTTQPTGAIVVQMNWRDNPWFTPELEQERVDCERNDSDGYPNIWEGECLPAIEGAIYAKEIGQLHHERRIRELPYDPMLKVHAVCDLGFNDALATGFFQRSMSEVRVIDYLEVTHTTLDRWSATLRAKGYNFGKLWLPHDAKNKTLAAGGVSTREIVERLGWNVEIVPDFGVEPGIKQARMLFARTYFDAQRTAPLLEHLKRYRRGISRITNEPSAPMHDEHSHGADMWRYAATVVEQFTNEDRGMSTEVFRQRQRERRKGIV